MERPSRPTRRATATGMGVFAEGGRGATAHRLGSARSAMVRPGDARDRPTMPYLIRA